MGGDAAELGPQPPWHFMPDANGSLDVPQNLLDCLRRNRIPFKIYLDERLLLALIPFRVGPGATPAGPSAG
ncbi:hypothetical protein A6A27_39150 [Micromonospora sp. CB01531]|nr:hypothetical protein A6A27_39150 [Micromonospora sp. CB01531]